MKFVKYETKEEFLADNLDILLKEEAKNEVIIGITLEHKSEKVKNWLLGRIEDENEVKAIFLVDDDRKGLLIYSLEEFISEEVVNCLVDNIIKLNIKLKEVLASKNHTKKIAEIYCQKADRKIYKSEFMYIFKFDKFREEHILNEGEKIEKLEDKEENLKPAEENVREMYADTYRGRECSDEDATRVAKIFFRKGLYVLRNSDNEIVSQAVTVRKQINSCAIGGVITLRRHRGHGYAKRCVYALCEKLLQEGYKFVVLHVNPQNDAAISVYKKIGFDKIDETEKVKFLIES